MIMIKQNDYLSDIPETYALKHTYENDFISQILRHAGTEGTPSIRKAFDGWLKPNEIEGETARKIYWIAKGYYEKDQRLPDIPSLIFLLKEYIDGSDAEKVLNDFRNLSDGKIDDFFIEGYIHGIKGAAVNRLAFQMADRFTTDALNLSPNAKDEEINAFIDKSCERLDKFRENIIPKRGDSLKDLRLASIDKVKNGQTDKILTTPFDGLNYILEGGIKTRNITLLSAQSGRGKTAFATQMILHLASKGAGILFFSLEMEKGDIYKNLIKQATRPDNGIKELDEALLNSEIVVEMDQLAISIIDSDDLGERPATIDFIRREVKRKKRELARDGKTLDFIAIDYIDYLEPTQEEEKRNIPEYKQLFLFTKQLKEIAKEEDIAVLLLTQLNKQDEISGSYKILQVADVAFKLSNDETAPTPQEPEKRGLQYKTLEIIKARRAIRDEDKTRQFIFNPKWLYFIEDERKTIQPAPEPRKTFKSGGKANHNKNEKNDSTFSKFESLSQFGEGWE